MGHWRSTLVWFLIFPSSFCRRISAGPQFPPITDKILGDWLAIDKANQLFFALPRFELAWKWRCRRDEMVSESVMVRETEMVRKMRGDICREIITVRGQSYVSLFQNINSPPTSPPGECVPPAFVGGGGHTRRAERGMGGSIFWKTRDIGVSYYSNNLSTDLSEVGFCELFTVFYGGFPTFAFVRNVCILNIADTAFFTFSVGNL
jgi:hypothetical protein